MTAGQRFKARVVAAQTAFRKASPSARWPRLLARLGFGRLAHRFLGEDVFLAVVLADFRRAMGAGPDSLLMDVDRPERDPHGRLHAYNEGARQAYLYLARLLTIDDATLAREIERLDREEFEATEERIEHEVRVRLRAVA